MQALTQGRMTANDFIAWSLDRPDGKRYELVDGEVVQMASERYGHARVRGNVFLRLHEAAKEAGIPCDVMPDGMAVRINHATVYEPDCALRIGPPLDLSATSYADPLLVVEVLSPSTGALDAGSKLADYFTLASLRHYLVLHPARRTAIHHARAADGTIQTHILTAGPLTLDPPGLALEVAALFE